MTKLTGNKCTLIKWSQQDIQDGKNELETRGFRTHASQIYSNCARLYVLKDLACTYFSSGCNRLVLRHISQVLR